MSTISTRQPFVVARTHVAVHPERGLWSVHAIQAMRILQTGFVALPIIAGVDKFSHLLTDWTRYLAPVFPRTLHVNAHTLMLGIGGVEILAGLLVAIVPRVGAYVVMFWLWGIVLNLVLLGGYYDIALRDVGLSLAALALGRLAQGHHEERRLVISRSRTIERSTPAVPS